MEAERRLSRLFQDMSYPRITSYKVVVLFIKYMQLSIIY